MARSFLILHGYAGSGPGHWQTWLADRLASAGERVAYPALPSPDAPLLTTWRSASWAGYACGSSNDSSRSHLLSSRAIGEEISSRGWSRTSTPARGSRSCKRA